MANNQPRNPDDRHPTQPEGLADNAARERDAQRAKDEENAQKERDAQARRNPPPKPTPPPPQQSKAAEILAKQVFSPRHGAVVALLTEGPDALLPRRKDTVETVIRALSANGITLEGMPAAAGMRKTICPDCKQPVNPGNDCKTCQRVCTRCGKPARSGDRYCKPCESKANATEVDDTL